MELFELTDIKGNLINFGALTEKQLDLLPLVLEKPLTDDDLWTYVKVFFGVAIPRKQICANCCSPFEAFADAYFARSPNIVWHAARGSGKSLQLALLAMVHQLTNGCEINVLGGSSQQSKRIIAYIQSKDPKCANILWKAPNAPTYMVDKALDTQYSSRLFTGGLINALMASDASVRGPHPNILLMDETDSTAWDLIESALGQPVSFSKEIINPETGDTYTRFAPRCTVFSSTWQRPDGSMSKVMEKARTEQDWLIKSWCYKEVIKSNGGWYPDQDIQIAKNTLTKRAFALEFECKEPMNQGTVWETSAIDLVFGVIPDKDGFFYPLHADRVKGKPIKYEGRASEVVHIMDPDPNITFYSGADWAKSIDSTILNTFAKNPTPGQADIMVHWERWEKLPWGVIIGRYNKQVAAYRGASAVDATGIGAVITDMLSHEATSVEFSNRKLITDIISGYVLAIENGEVRIPYIEYVYKEHKFATYEQLYTSKDHLPDSVVAAALAWHVRTKAEFSLKMFRPSESW